MSVGKQSLRALREEGTELRTQFRTEKSADGSVKPAILELMGRELPPILGTGRAYNFSCERVRWIHAMAGAQRTDDLDGAKGFGPKSGIRHATEACPIAPGDIRVQPT
jgi:hypothetical protein